MHILMLCKRQYTGRDLLDDRYGRLYSLPVGLASRGHSVTVILASYRPRGRVDRMENGVRWRSVDLLPCPIAVTAAWHDAAASQTPDVVVASADALQLVGGARFARELGCPVVLDLYDDYESFALTRLPGLRTALRIACSRADAVVAVSGTLARTLSARGVDSSRVHVLGNGVPEGFVPIEDRAAARQRLGLPMDATLVGTAGALNNARGIRDLLGAVRLLQSSFPALRLAVAGPRDSAFSAQLPPGSIDLGQRPHKDVALLFRALDVGVICNRDSAFARACHPMKLVEMVACGTPVVAADVGEVSHLLSTRPDARYPPGDAAILAERILCQIQAPRPLKPTLAESWFDLSVRLEHILEDVLRRC